MRRALLVCFACIWALVLSLPAFATPAFAEDGSYSIDELSTEMTVETNGAIHVVERTTVTFSDCNAGMVWYLHSPGGKESLRISSVRYAPVDKGGSLLADWTNLQMIDSNSRLQGRDPGDTASASMREQGNVQPWYSYNIGDGMLRCYFPTGEVARKAADKQAEASENAEDNQQDGEGDAGKGQSGNEPDDGQGYRTYAIEVDYVLTHHLSVYGDVAELYWRYANDSLPADAYNVTLQVRLPVPAEVDSAEASREIMAWGHGPDGGSFSIGDDGTVTYRNERVERGGYAEAHIIFPSEWVSNLRANDPSRQSGLRRAAAIEEESGWVDVSLREAEWDNKVRVLFLSLAVVIIIVGAIAVVRNGRSPKSRRALMRVAVTLGIVALGEHLFFREPLTTLMLAALAVVVGFVAAMMPAEELMVETDEPETLEGRDDV